MIKKILIFSALIGATAYFDSLYSNLCECTISTEKITEAPPSAQARRVVIKRTNIADRDECKALCQDKKAELGFAPNAYMHYQFTKGQ